MDSNVFLPVAAPVMMDGEVVKEHFLRTLVAHIDVNIPILRDNLGGNTNRYDYVKVTGTPSKQRMDIRRWSGSKSLFQLSAWSTILWQTGAGR